MVDLGESDELTDHSLMAAKLSVPSTRSVTVSRASLVDQLRATADKPLVAVTAPAGYGKTALLAEWVAVEERPVGWLTLDKHDDDPVVFAAAVLGALARIDPEAGSRFAGWSTTESTAQSVSRRLAATIGTIRRPFVLVIDDVHHLTVEDAVELIDHIVGCLPPGSQLAVASRVDLAFIARRRVGGQALEFGPSDLQLDADAAIEVFAAAGAPLDPTLADEVIARTEGWPAGIYLAALVARRIPDAWHTPLPISGEDRFIADYLSREALETLPDRVKQFLLLSSVLEEMSASLCEAALGVTDADEMLRELERSNLFLVPLDRRRQWFRFHSLFRDLLMGELRRRDPSAISDIRRRAARWHVANGAPERAVDYLLLDGDSDDLAPLLASLLRPRYHEGHLATIRRWLDQCKPELMERYPPLAVLASWIAALTGDPVTAERWAETASRLTFEGPPPDGSASFGSALALLRALLCASGPERMEEDASFAVANEPTWSPWRDTALWLQGEALRLLDQSDAASKLYSEAIDLSSPSRLGGRPPMLMALVGRALEATESGDWSQAEADSRAAVAQTSVTQAADYIAAAMTHAVAARVARHYRRDHEVMMHLDLATRSRLLATFAVPYVAVELRLILADLHTTHGDPVVALEIVSEAESILLHRPLLGSLVEETKRMRRRLSAESNAQAVLTPAELRVLPHLRTHLTFAEIGRRLYVSRNTVNSQAGSIYRKLGVSSRGAAVDRARELGLLGD